MTNQRARPGFSWPASTILDVATMFFGIFLVKVIVKPSGICMPGFFGYMLYSRVIPLPILVLANWIFL